LEAVWFTTEVSAVGRCGSAGGPDDEEAVAVEAVDGAEAGTAPDAVDIVPVDVGRAGRRMVS